MRETCSKSGVSRRTVLFAAASAAPLLALMTGTAEAAKIAQDKVKYQAEPSEGKQCDGCNFFEASNACKLVDGEIAPTGWCILWSRKTAT